MASVCARPLRMGRGARSTGALSDQARPQALSTSRDLFRGIRGLPLLPVCVGSILQQERWTRMDHVRPSVCLITVLT